MSKADALMAAIGDVDEANSALGVAIVQIDDAELRARLQRIQNDLFDLGADLATPWNEGADDRALRITPGQVERLEGEIDAANATLEPLRSFILPGGSAAAAALHVARAVTRRAERSIVAASVDRALNPAALAYANRLSDLLFVLCRELNKCYDGDVLWMPGASR